MLKRTFLSPIIIVAKHSCAPVFFLYGRCRFCFVSQSEKVAPTQRCLEHSVKTVRTCFCSCQGLVFLSESRGVMPGINSHCCPPGPQLDGNVPSLCLTFPPPVKWRQQGFCLSQKCPFRDLHVSEDHCNKNITEKRSIIFRINLRTVSDSTYSGDTLEHQGGEWTLTVKTETSSK